MAESVPDVAIAPAPVADIDAQWADLRPIIDWGRQHWVIVAGLAMIVAEVAWKAGISFCRC